MGRVVWQLLKWVGQRQRRFEILKLAFERGRALFLIQKALIVLGQQQGMYGSNRAQPEKEWFVTREQVADLEQAVIQKIRRASQDGSLLHTPRLLLLLRFWREQGGQSEARAWTTEVIKDDQKLAELLERCLASNSSIGFGDAVGRRNDRLDPKWLEPYVDVEQLVSRARNLAKSDAPLDRQRRAVNQLIKEYEIRKRGGNPDDPFSQDQLS